MELLLSMCASFCRRARQQFANATKHRAKGEAVCHGGLGKPSRMPAGTVAATAAEFPLSIRLHAAGRRGGIATMEAVFAALVDRTYKGKV